MITPGTWSWWTSNSFTRLMAENCGRTVSVLAPVKLRDGQPHIVVTPDDMALIAASPVMLAMLEKIAGECVECGGEGSVDEINVAGKATGDRVACPDCAEICRVICLARKANR
jgi:hypothetical protein